MVLGALNGFASVGVAHFHDVGIEVVAFDGPVYHVFVAGQSAVAQHHVLLPQPVGFARIGAQRVGAAAGKQARVVASRALYGDVVVVLLERGSESHVLNNVVCAVGGDVLAGEVLALHAKVVFHASQGSHVAQLGGVDNHFGVHCECVGSVYAHKCPMFIGVLCHLQWRVAMQNAQLLLLCSNVMENAVAHAWLELHVAHPAGFQGVEAAVVGGEAVEKLAPERGAQVIVAVDGAHTGSGEHAAKPRSFFNNHRIHTHARRLHTGSNAACAAAHHQHLSGAAPRCRLG